MNHRRAYRYFVISILLISAPFEISAQSLHFINGKKNKTIGFQYIKNLVIIPLQINGKGPYNFVLDTGIGITLITDPSLADSLGLKNLRTLKISGFGEGEELEAGVTPSLLINIGNNILGEISAAILKHDTFNLSAYTGMPVHGLIGYEFFSSFIVKLNYYTNTVKLYSPRTTYVPRKGQKIPVTIEDRKPYLVAVATLSPGNHKLVKLIIDTGAGHPVSLESDDSIPFPVPEPNIRANLGVGLGGAISGYIARIPALSLGKYQFKNVVTAFPDFQDAAGKFTRITRNGNIGNSILRRFTVVFDYGSSCMYIRANARFKAPFEHDMSGLELAWAGAGYRSLIISRVEKGSAADEAGLEENDVITDINLKPSDQIGTEEIHDLLQSGNNRNIMLRIRKERSGKLQVVILTLKRRI